jgi:hypothetical protein
MVATQWRCKGVAGVDRYGDSGGQKGRGLVQKGERDAYSPLGHSERLFGAGRGVVAGAGRLGRRTSPACDVLTSGAG